MDPLGDNLKQAREKKGLSLEHIAAQTRIQEHHLQALESEDFADLPAKVFTKGFVRSYAKALGLDEEEAIQSFLHASGTFYEQNQPEQPHTQVRLEAGSRQGINWNLVVAILVIIAVGAVWYGLPKQEETPTAQSEEEASSQIEPVEESIPLPSEPEEIITPTPNDTVIDAVQPLPTPPISNPVQPKPQPNPPTPTPPTQPIEKNLPGESHSLEIEATQLTWVVVKSDEQDSNEALLQPGQRSTWKAEKEFQITLGNAAGVVIRLNGQTQGPFGKPGQVVRDIRLRP